ncbi:MAG: DUF4493 domain-containing protein [Alistipes sp.]|nr:DUF4493 domain-containing protein [Alistipes sp.]
METSAPISSTQGYLLLSMDEIDVSQLTTTQSKAITTPQVSNFNLTVTSISSGQVVYSGPIPSEPLIEEVGNYTLTASYGSATSIGVNTPYFEGSTTVEIQSMTLTRASLTATLQSALIEPEIATELASHFSSYYVEAVCGTTTTQLTAGIISSTAGETLCVPAGPSVSCTLKGTNLLGESVATSLGTLSAVEAATRYKVNCNASLPQFTVPAQTIPNAGIWASKAYFTLTPMTSSNVSRGNSTKVVSQAVYEVSVNNGQSWSTVGSENGYQVVSGLSPNTSYTLLFRSRFSNIVSTNTTQVSLTTEAASQVGNSGFEHFTASTVTYKAWTSSYTQPTYAPSDASEAQWWACNNAKSCNSSIATTSQYPNRKCFPTVSYTTSAHSGSKAAQLITVGLSNGGTAGTVVGTSYVGEMWIGTEDGSGNRATEGFAFSSRPTKLQFSYNFSSYNSESFYLLLQIKDASGNTIGNVEVTDNASTSGWGVKTVAIPYTNIMAKAAKIYMTIKPTTSNGKQLNRTIEMAGTNYTGVCYGSCLKVDDLTLLYD